MLKKLEIIREGSEGDGEAYKGNFYSLLAVCMVGMVLPVAFSQEEEEVVSPLKEVAGTIVSVNLEKSTIVVEYLKDEATNTYDEVTVNVDASTVIERNNEAISLAELIAGNEVKIKCTTDENGKNIASNIQTTAKE